VIKRSILSVAVRVICEDWSFRPREEKVVETSDLLRDGDAETVIAIVVRPDRDSGSAGEGSSLRLSPGGRGRTKCG